MMLLRQTPALSNTDKTCPASDKTSRTVNYSIIEGSSSCMFQLSGYLVEHSKTRLAPLKKKEKSSYSKMPFLSITESEQGTFLLLSTQYCKIELENPPIHSRVHTIFSTPTQTFTSKQKSGRDGKLEAF